MALRGDGDPRQGMEIVHVLVMLLLWLVAGTVLAAAVLFMTDIVLG